MNVVDTAEFFNSESHSRKWLQDGSGNVCVEREGGERGHFLAAPLLVYHFLGREARFLAE